jgi:hypothetical protein
MNYYDIYEEMNKIDDDASLVQNSKKTVNELFDKAETHYVAIDEHDRVDSAKLARYLVSVIEAKNGKIRDKVRALHPENNSYVIPYTAKKKDQERIEKAISQINAYEFLSDTRDNRVNALDGHNAVINAIRVK